MLSNQSEPIQNIIEEIGDDKSNIYPADISRCYDIIKQMSLKRYTLSEYSYPSYLSNDRNVLGWINEDVCAFLPKSIKTTDRICNPKQVYLANQSGVVEPIVISYDRVMKFKTLQKDQIYAHMYGALQKVIQDKEALEEKVSRQQDTIDSLLAWAKTQGFQPPM